MPSINDVEKLATELHDNKLINLDSPLRDLLRPTGVGVIDPASPVSDNAVAWSDYVLITKGKPTDIRTIEALSSAIRGAIGGNINP